MLILRIISFIILFLSVAFLPWPVTVALTLMAIAVFPWFWEAVIMGIFLGAMYGSESLFAFFIFSLTMVFFVEEYLKSIIQGQNIISRAIIILSGGMLFFLLWLIFNLVIHV
jgi:hypothetical protein